MRFAVVFGFTVLLISLEAPTINAEPVNVPLDLAIVIGAQVNGSKLTATKGAIRALPNTFTIGETSMRIALLARPDDTTMWRVFANLTGNMSKVTTALDDIPNFSGDARGAALLDVPLKMIREMFVGQNTNRHRAVFVVVDGGTVTDGGEEEAEKLRAADVWFSVLGEGISKDAAEKIAGDTGMVKVDGKPGFLENQVTASLAELKSGVLNGLVCEYRNESCFYADALRTTCEMSRWTGQTPTKVFNCTGHVRRPSSNGSCSINECETMCNELWHPSVKNCTKKTCGQNITLRIAGQWKWQELQHCKLIHRCRRCYASRAAGVIAGGVILPVLVAFVIAGGLVVTKRRNNVANVAKGATGANGKGANKTIAAASNDKIDHAINADGAAPSKTKSMAMLPGATKGKKAAVAPKKAKGAAKKQ